MPTYKKFMKELLTKKRSFIDEKRDYRAGGRLECYYLEILALKIQGSMKF